MKKRKQHKEEITPEEIKINSYKRREVARVNSATFRILERKLIDGRKSYKFQYKCLFVWKTLKGNCPYFPSDIILYADSIKDASLFLEVHFGYGVFIKTKYSIL